MKKFISGILVGALLMVSFTVFGAGTAKTIKTIFNQSTVKIDNKTVAGDKITYNNKVYIESKAVADALGKDYKIDAKTKAVTITAKPVPPTVKGTRTNPAKIGETIKGATDSLMAGKFTYSITLKEVIRGEEAWKLVEAANMFNDAPEEGYEVILAKFDFKVLTAADKEKQYDLNGVSFKLVSSAGKDYENYFCVVPDPNLDANLYEGASNEGWVALQVKTDDLKPLIVFDKKYDGTGGAWFVAYK